MGAVYFRGQASIWSVAKLLVAQGITRDITFLKLFPEQIDIELWEQRFVNSKRLFYIDKMAVVLGYEYKNIQITYGHGISSPMFQI